MYIKFCILKMKRDIYKVPCKYDYGVTWCCAYQC